MASIVEDKKGNLSVSFRWAGTQFARSARTTDGRVAAALSSRIDETMRLIQSGRIELPPDAEPGTFIFSDGMQERKPVAK